MFAVAALCLGLFGQALAQSGSAPAPLLEKGHPVQWWFVFKFNAASFPGCASAGANACEFGGEPQDYKLGQQFVYASSEDQSLQKAGQCVGTGPSDPVGATFEQVYQGSYSYVVWNDQFYDDPSISGCGNSCNAPWGHSKGVVAWNDAGEGLVMQVSTPSWPASGSSERPRKTDGNTLGCVKTDDVLFSQHFFSVQLTKGDLMEVLKALANASVVTDPGNPQVVRNGGPPDVQDLVRRLGAKSSSHQITKVQLSSGIGLLSKPSGLHVPPWQLVSAELGGVPLRAATWWAPPAINSTTASTQVGCWDAALPTPGAVQIATSGSWGGQHFGLKGGPGPNFNHAKIGVSTSGQHHFAIFGDMNQQGSLSDSCGRSQNGRGGLFYVIDNAALSTGIGQLIEGDSAPVEGAGQ